MATEEKSASLCVVLAAVVAFLVITVILVTGVAIYGVRMATEFRLVAEARERELQQRAAVAERDRDSLIYFAQYFKHVVGVAPLTDSELNVVRPSIAGDTEMAVVLQTFEADMASINQVLGSGRQVATYHEAVVACRELLDKDAD